MLDLKRLQRIKLHKRPKMQVFIANVGLRLDYRFPRRTTITLEGLENIPRDRGVFFAMNHTDRYNYWPFQYQMYRHGGLRFTATWVKGKYYEKAMMGAFMDATNNIPLPSRGYVITTLFREALKRVPTEVEYKALRALVDGKADAKQAAADGGPGVAQWVAGFGGEEAALAQFETYFGAMMAEVTRLTRDALTKHELNVLVFPQGTRSKRLSKGHTGLMQMAQHLGVDIVPVGCNGSDGAYPGGSPFSKGGDLVYRVGAPLRLDGPELGAFRVTEPYTPFTHEASAFADRFQAATDVVMDHINGLLDEPYRFGDDHASDGVDGVGRFV